MDKRDEANETGTYHLYGELTQRLKISGAIHQLQLDAEVPDPFEDTSGIKSHARWTQRVLSWFSR